MTARRVLIGVIVFLFALLVVLEVFAPKPFNWRETYDSRGKDPFDTRVFYELLPSLHEGIEVERTRQTIYELYEKRQQPGHMVSVAQFIDLDETSLEPMLDFVRQGGTVFLAAHDFSWVLEDEFNFTTQDALFANGMPWWEQENGTVELLDTVEVTFEDHWGGQSFRYPSEVLTKQLVIDYVAQDYEVVAHNDFDEPVLVRFFRGKGEVYLCTVPIGFTNFNLVHEQNHAFASQAIGHAQLAGRVWYSDFFSLGRDEIGSPLRFIMSQRPLRWAYYLLILTLLLFVIIGIKRRQRIIPVLEPPRNDTLTFVRTIGGLYFEKANHSDLARKKVTYWLDYVRTALYLSTDKLDAAFAERLAAKSGKPLSLVDRLVKTASALQSTGVAVSKEQLKNLNKLLEKFYA